MAVMLGAFKLWWGRHIEHLPGLIHNRLNAGKIIAAAVAELKTMLYLIIGLFTVLKSASGMPCLPAGFSTGTFSQ